MSAGESVDIPALFAAESAQRTNTSPNAYPKTRAEIAAILSEKVSTSRAVHVSLYRNLSRLANTNASFLVLEWKLGDESLATGDAKEDALTRILEEAKNTQLKATIVAFKEPLSSGEVDRRFVALAYREGAYSAASIAALASRLGLGEQQVTAWPAAPPLPPPTGDGPVKAPTHQADIAAWRPRAPLHLNLVLEGVPGTGKTYWMKTSLRRSFNPDGSDIGALGDGAFAITLHPATSYEDFVEGLRPGVSAPTLVEGEVLVDGKSINVATPAHRESWFFCACGPRASSPASPTSADGPAPSFAVHDGFFLRACAHAVANPHKGFVVLLDEFNRCNVPKVIGDLLTTLESSKRATWQPGKGWDTEHSQVVTLPYSGRKFFVPSNVVVVGTMNTTDRSVTGLDGALRRRFAFERVWPIGFNNESRAFSAEELSAELQLVGLGSVPTLTPASPELAAAPASSAPDQFGSTIWAWAQLNQALLAAFGPDGMLGHSYLFDMQRALMGDARYWSCPGEADLLREHWNRFILPQLVEIFENANATANISLDASPLVGLRQNLASIGTLMLEHPGQSVLLRRISLHLWPNSP